MFKCEYCEKNCITTQSYAQHRTRCLKNPNRQNPKDWSTGNRKGCVAWNKGLKNDVRCQLSNAAKSKLSKAISIRNANETLETKNKRRETIRKKVEKGEWHTSLAKKMHYTYNGVDLHGKWELKYAQYLDANGINWERCKTRFSYFFEGKQRSYTPDFYLRDRDTYVEIKGYKTAKDEAKWNQFPKELKLQILLKNDLKKLSII